MLTKMLHKNDDKGFTLIELLIVIAIIGILAAIAVPIFLSQSTNANRSAAEAQASSLNSLVGAQLALTGNTGTIAAPNATPARAAALPTVAGTPVSGTVYDGNQAGDLVVTDGTIAIQVNDLLNPGTSYCVSSTVDTQTAAYGPAANSAGTGCNTP